MDNNEPQIDYAYSNSELIPDSERKKRLLLSIKDLIAHVAGKFTDVAKDMGADTVTPKFNDTLSVHNGFNTHNPLATPNTLVRPNTSVRPRITRKRVIRNMRSTRLYK